MAQKIMTDSWIDFEYRNREKVTKKLPKERSSELAKQGGKRLRTGFYEIYPAGIRGLKKWPILMDNYIYLCGSWNLGKELKPQIKEFAKNYYLSSPLISFPKVESISEFVEIEEEVIKSSRTKIDDYKDLTDYYKDLMRNKKTFCLDLRKTVATAKDKYDIKPENIKILFGISEKGYGNDNFIVEALSPYKDIMISKAFNDSPLDEAIRKLRKNGKIKFENIMKNCKGMVNSYAAERIAKTCETVKEIIRLMEKYAEKSVRDENEVKAVVLYGSVANGIARDNSDTDAMIITSLGNLYEKAGGSDLEFELLWRKNYADEVVRYIKNNSITAASSIKLWEKQYEKVEELEKKIEFPLASIMRVMTLDDPWLIAMEFALEDRELIPNNKKIWRRLKNNEPADRKLRFMLAGPTITLLGDDIVYELKEESKRFIKKYGEEKKFFENLCGKIEEEKNENLPTPSWMVAGLGMH